MFKCLLAVLLMLINISNQSDGFTNHRVNGNNEEIVTNNAIFNSNKYTQVENESNKDTNELVKIEEDFSFVCKDDNLELYINVKTLELRIRNIKTGYVWGSSFNTANEKLNKTWKSRVSSALWLTYYHKTKTKDEIKDDIISKVTVKIENNGFKAHCTFLESKIELDMNLSLKNGKINVSIPNDSIVESESNRISTLKVYPFFGACKATETENFLDGYTLIPDGSGALIRYRPTSQINKSTYTKSIYGNDYAFIKDSESNTIYNDSTISIPLIGFVHGVDKNASYVSVNDGDLYSRIISYEAGKLIDFYWTSFEFVYRVQYQRKTSKSTSVLFTQLEKNKFDIDICYSILSGKESNYVGIANSYGKELEFKNMDNKKSNIPIHVEYLNSEIEKRIIFNKSIPMTTTKQNIEITNDLLNNGINNISLGIRGFANKGYTASAPYYKNFNFKTGWNRGYKNLINYCKQQDINLFFNVDFQKGYKASRGFSKMRDLALMANSEEISGSSYDFPYSYLSPDKSLKIFKNNLNFFNKNGMNSLCFESIADIIYSSYDSNNMIYLPNAKEYYKEMLNSVEYSSSFGTNKYVYDSVNELYNGPLYSSQVKMFTDTVPFVSLVLKNKINLFSGFINDFSSLKLETLRLIDYNIYPSVILTHKSSIDLMDTPSRKIVSSKYSAIKDSLIETYNYINEALKYVMNDFVIERKILASGVVKNTYSNHKVIYINYLNEPITYDDITIDAMSYKVGDAL